MSKDWDWKNAPGYEVEVDAQPAEMPEDWVLTFKGAGIDARLFYRDCFSLSDPSELRVYEVTLYQGGEPKLTCKGISQETSLKLALEQAVVLGIQDRYLGMSKAEQT